MGATDRQTVKAADPKIQVSDSTIDEKIEDAKTLINGRWAQSLQDYDASNGTNIEERVQTYVTLHLIHMITPEVSSDSNESGKSVTNTWPTGNVNEWLRNTEPGRTAARFLSMAGITTNASSRPTPKTFR